jgi:protein arginine N-methyltransferase 1
MLFRSEYNLMSHGRMLRDPQRVGSYLEALRDHVSPDMVVLEIGTGIGFFAVAAAKLGAEEVIAVEIDSSVYVAKGVADANDVSDTIVFYRGSSLDLELEQKANLVISDLRGVLPFYGEHLRIIIDARERLTTPDAVFIPKCDDLLVSLATSNYAYSMFDEPWNKPINGIDLTFARPFAVNSWSTVNASADTLLTEAKIWARLNYSTLTEPDARGEVTLTVVKEGEAHGLIVWFDAIISSGVCFSNAPGTLLSAYGQAFFPIENPVQVKPGDQIEVKLSAQSFEDDYVWSWETVFHRQDQEILHFRQSTVRGWTLPPAP